MNKIKGFVKKNYKIVIGFILGIIVCVGIGVSAVATKDITYDNSTSGLTSTNLQGAIDELNTKATTKINEAKNECPDGYICNAGSSKVSTKNNNIISSYSYNSSNCITGEESTCKQTNCINYSNVGACPAGTIIKYKVNSNTTKYFHVLHDDGETMTLQQRENTVYNTAWDLSSDFNSNGPLTILPALESATSGWTNVNNQIYTMGTTNFNNTKSYTGCAFYNSCTKNTYTLDERTAKARMITVQEATAVGCTDSNQSCPNWMNNYLYNSTSYGGTVDDTTGADNYGYWTMTATESFPYAAWDIAFQGDVDCSNPDKTYYNGKSDKYFGARAVVVVNK